jgi:LPS O-antigen subunit length determinant protein (WzzB/FepE family)
MIEIVRGESEAAVKVEQLDIERERLRRLELDLAQQRERLRAEVADEVERLQAALRRASQRAAERQQELDELRRKGESKGGRERFATLRGRLSEGDPSPDLDPAPAALEQPPDPRHAEELAHRETVLAEREESLSRAERMWEPMLDERTARLDEATAALDERERLVLEREEALEAGLRAVQDRERRLGELELELEERMRAVETVLAARAVSRDALSPPPLEPVGGERSRVGFSEGLRSLQQRSSPDT